MNGRVSHHLCAWSDDDRRCQQGYCFIVVSAFAALLQALGFRCSLHSAACMDEDDPRLLSGDGWGDHVVLVAHMSEGHFVADVGLGTGPSGLMRLEEHAWSEPASGGQAQFEYSLERRPEPGRWRFVNDGTASFSGFSVKLDTSAAAASEFDA